MLMTDVIVKKREGEKLSAEEIKFVVDGYTKGEIPDYQMSALLMAILLRGMDREETLELTMAMRDSGETLDLSAIKGVKADKHRRRRRQDLAHTLPDGGRSGREDRENVRPRPRTHGRNDRQA